MLMKQWWLPIEARYLNDSFPQGAYAEDYFGGQWLALHLSDLVKFGQLKILSYVLRN